jgi:hypothetical protein
LFKAGLWRIILYSSKLASIALMVAAVSATGANVIIPTTTVLGTATFATNAAGDRGSFTVSGQITTADTTGVPESGTSTLLLIGIVAVGVSRLRLGSR